MLLLLSLSFIAKRSDSVVKIAIAKKKLPDSLLIKISVTSQTNQSLKLPLPEHLKVGYENDISADCYFETLEITGSSQKFVVPTTDYQFYNKKVKDPLFILKKGKSLNYYFNLSDYYVFNLNKRYKARLVFRLSRYNKTKDVVSDWIEID